MLVNEKALAHQLKEAYRHGYKVEENDGVTYIAATAWGVAIPTEILPRKILGLLAEHAGEIPAGKAMLVRKNRNNQMLFKGEVVKLFDITTEGEEAYETAITYKNRWTIFQKADSSLVAFDTELLDLVNVSDMFPPQIFGQMEFGRWEAMNQAVIIAPMRKEKNLQLDYLQRFNWRLPAEPPEDEGEEENGADEKEPTPEEEFQLIWTEIPDKPPEEPPKNE